MKALGYTMAIGGFILIIGTAGSADFYEECRAAADCVAGEPMSTMQMVLQSIAGLIFMGTGIKIIAD